MKYDRKMKSISLQICNLPVFMKKLGCHQDDKPPEIFNRMKDICFILSKSKRDKNS